MQLALSKPVSRSAALALLLLALLLVHAFVVRPLASSWHDAVDAIQESRALASRYARTAAARSQYEEQVVALRAEKPNPQWFLMGETDALAAAAMQDRIGSLAQSAGAEIRSIQTARRGRRRHTPYRGNGRACREDGRPAAGCVSDRIRDAISVHQHGGGNCRS